MVKGTILQCMQKTKERIYTREFMDTMFYATPMALLPPLIAIILALITKEVYSSLFVGILTGALLYANFNLEVMIQTMFFHEEGGMISKLSDGWNVGILVFLVILGIIVSVMNKVGGSAAFGEWAAKRIKNKTGAQLATLALGVMIFVDDYFNCLTVGNVMRPVTDKYKVSREKLAYIIDATAAPICIIAPISSWAAAVTSSVPDGAEINGFTTFIKTIPYNFYAVFTLVAVAFFCATNADFGQMRVEEEKAKKATRKQLDVDADDAEKNPVEHTKGKVIDLIIPVVVLIAACIVSMIYTGGFFDVVNLVDAFANSDASQGLVMGSFIALIFTFIFYMLRKVISFEGFMECIPEGFKMMVSSILILSLAWTLSGMTNLLGASEFVSGLVAGSVSSMQAFLPAIIFVIAFALSFATGTSWGTFGILIPIVVGVFPSGEMMVISIASCLSGAVCGDHCSPISDTTILASAGAQCNHVAHVSTQLPYVLIVAPVACISFIIAGFTKNLWISLVVGLLILLVVLYLLKKQAENVRDKEV